MSGHHAAANAFPVQYGPMWQMAPKPFGDGVLYRSDDGGRTWKSLPR